MTRTITLPTDSPLASERQRLSPPVQIDPHRQARRSRALARAVPRRLGRPRRALGRPRHKAEALRLRSIARRPGAHLAGAGACTGARVLDAGCGSGQFAIPLAQRGAVVTGIDLSPEMMRLASDRAVADHHLPIDWRIGELERVTRR